MLGLVWILLPYQNVDYGVTELSKIPQMSGLGLLDLANKNSKMPSLIWILDQ